MNNQHPYIEPGTKRICPITGKRFEVCWSKIAAFDSCDSCCPDAPRLSDRLHKLNQERKTCKPTDNQ